MKTMIQCSFRRKKSINQEISFCEKTDYSVFPLYYTIIFEVFVYSSEIYYNLLTVAELDTIIYTGVIEKIQSSPIPVVGAHRFPERSLFPETGQSGDKRNIITSGIPRGYRRSSFT